jgi:hypothetical protein
MIVPIQIPGYEHYSISTEGTVYSTINTTRTKTLTKLKIRKSHPNKNTGYHQVLLQNGKLKLKPKLFYVHRLVALHFIPNPNNHNEVNHLNFNRSDNHIENLEWVTTRENVIHSIPNRNNIVKLISNDKELLEQGLNSYRKIQCTSRVSKLWNCCDNTTLKILRLFDLKIKWEHKKPLELV